MKIEPREYQVEIVDSIFKELDHHNKLMVESSVSSGKTVMMLELAKQLNQQYNIGVVIGLTFSSLVDQFIDTAGKMGIDICVLKAGYKREKNARIQVAMEQTAIGNLKDLIDADVYILEEAHVRVGSSRYETIRNHIRPKYEIGFSGTPYTSQGCAIKGFHNIGGISHQDCEDMGFLTPLRFIRTKGCTIDTRTLSHSGEDFSIEELDSKVDQLLDNIIEYMSKIEESIGFSFKHASSIWFTASIEEAEKVAKKLQESGYDIYAYHSKSKNNEAIMEAFKTKKPIKEEQNLFDNTQPKYVRGLVSVMGLSIGFDVPHVEMAIPLRVSKVRSKDVQQIGRVARKYTPLDDLLQKIRG